MPEVRVDLTAWWSTHGPEAIFASRIRHLRRARDWSQTDLAKRMQDLGFAFHQNTVSRIESGAQSVTLNEAAALAMIFGVSADELLQPDQSEDELNRLSADLDAVTERLHDIDAQLAQATHEMMRHEQAVRQAQDHLDSLRHQQAMLAGQRDALAAHRHSLHQQQAKLRDAVRSRPLPAHSEAKP